MTTIPNGLYYTELGLDGEMEIFLRFESEQNQCTMIENDRAQTYLFTGFEDGKSLWTSARNSTKTIQIQTSGDGNKNKLVVYGHSYCPEFVVEVIRPREDHTERTFNPFW